MAKPRKKTPVRSSMTRFLQADTAALALEEVEQIDQVPEEIPATSPAESLKIISTPQTNSRGGERKKVSVPPLAPRAETPIYSKAQLEQASISRKREIGFSNRSNRVLDTLVSAYVEATGGAVTTSHVIRAMLLATEDALPEILDEISSLGPMKRPGNEKKFDVEREEYEKALGAAFLDGLRKLG